MSESSSHNSNQSLQPDASDQRSPQTIDNSAASTTPAQPTTPMMPQKIDRTSHLPSEHAQKKRFALFVKILFKQLDRSEESAELREVAKNIVLDCTRRNRLGDPDYKPLMDAVDRRLRHHVGEAHWRRAHLYMQQYMHREAFRTKAGLPKPIRTAMVWMNMHQSAPQCLWTIVIIHPNECFS